MVVLTLAPFLPKKLTLLVLFAFGVLNIFLDYRILGAVFIVVAAIIWARTGRSDQSAISFAKYAKLSILIGLGLIGIVGTILLTQDEYAARRDASNVGRLSAIIVSMRAIADSPIVGYGSWTVNQRYAEMVRREIEMRRDQSLPEVQQLGSGSDFNAHSAILQSWVEGGLLGAAFFFVYGYQLVRSIHWHSLHRQLDHFSAVFTFTLIISLWAWMASPFSGNQRIQIAMAVSVIAAEAYDRRKKIRDTAKSGPRVRPARPARLARIR
jgi:O-antigen ligase